MRRLLLVLASVLALTSGAPARAVPGGGGPFDFELTRLADGVYAAIRPDPARQPGEGNVTFIVNEHDVVVVDSGDFTKSAENLIALLRTVTDKPVSAVINTHWHGDHNFGNAEFKRVFPQAEIIGHPTHAANLIRLPAIMADQAKGMPEQLASMKKMADTGLSPSGKTVPESMRKDFRELLEWMPIALPEYSRVKLQTATLTVADTLVLKRGAREIHIKWLGYGNTDGDLVVWLPKERIVATGDLVVMPHPYAFGSFPKHWPETLQRLMDLDWQVLVPGHGLPQRDRVYLKNLQDAIRAVDAEVVRMVGEGKDLATIQKDIKLDPALVQRFTGGDAGQELRFMAVFAKGLAKSSYKLATGKPIDQVDIF
jgi:cyclase